MTLPRTAAQVLSGHVRLEICCIDRMLLTFRQPRLQYGQGIHGFFCHHRGYQFVSSALMRPMTERFAADIRHYIDVRGLDLVRFAKGQSKDEVARGYLAGHDGGEQILFAGVAQEKTRVWRTRQRRDPVTGKRYPWLCQEQAMVNHWYFYGFDADFGPYADRLVMPRRAALSWSRAVLRCRRGIEFVLACGCQRVSRKARRLSGAAYRPGGVPSGASLERACSLSAMSACR
jgi:hypothetical protein